MALFRQEQSSSRRRKRKCLCCRAGKINRTQDCSFGQGRKGWRRLKFYIKSVQEGREKLIIKMKVNEPGLVWLILCHPGNVHLVMGDYPVLRREGGNLQKDWEK